MSASQRQIVDEQLRRKVVGVPGSADVRAAFDVAMIAIRQLEALVKSERLRVVALGDMVMENDDVRRVTHLVSEETGIRERVILSNHPRPTDVCDARFLLSWLLREVQPRTSATSLGRATGTDHSGFLHRVRRARDLMETNASFKARALRLRDMLLTTEEKP